MVTSNEHGDDAGRILAQTWSLAANFRTPAEYGIPTAPVFEANYCDDGTLVLVASNSGKTVLTAKRASRVRR